MKATRAGVMCLALLAPTIPARAQSQNASAPPLLTANAQLTLDEIADISGGAARGSRFLDKLEHLPS